MVDRRQPPREALPVPTTRRSLLALSAAATASLTALGPRPARAQAWPERPVTVVVPFPPGGGTDTFARPLAAALGARLGQTFVIDNRGGAGGTLGAGTAARAEKDGYTLLFGAVHHAIAPGVYPELAYDIEKDFQPVAVVAVVPQVVVVNPDRVKAATLAELVAFAKANPDALTYDSAGSGTSHHLAGELFKIRAGVEIRHVPYKGAGPALQDLIGGQIDMMFDGLGSSAGHIRSGRIRPLAVAAPARAAVLPDVPTAAEAGLAGYEVSTWYALWALAGTPPEIVDRLVAEVGASLASEEVGKTWAAQGASPGPLRPDEMAAFVSSEIARWARVAKDAGVKVE
jgi:tripartite-type tricarboxylate transporter receptor subunit TctC